MTRRFAMADPSERDRGLTMAASVVRRGGLVVVPVEHTYAVVADPFTATAVEALIASKGRTRPIAVPVLVPAAATVDGITHGISQSALDLMAALWPGELTLIAPVAPSMTWDLGTPGCVTVRMPIHPVALDLLGRSGPLAAMTANRLGEPAPTTLDEALSQLGGAVEVALDGGARPAGEGSSIVDVTANPSTVLRVGGVSFEAMRSVVPDLVGPS